MSNLGRTNLSGINIDPKLAAEQLGGGGGMARSFNMDDLGFKQLATVLPGVKSSSQPRQHVHEGYTSSGTTNSAHYANYESNQSNGHANPSLYSHPSDHSIPRQSGYASAKEYSGNTQPLTGNQTSNSSSFPQHRAPRQRDAEPFIVPAPQSNASSNQGYPHPSNLHSQTSNSSYHTRAPTNQWSQYPPSGESLGAPNQSSQYNVQPSQLPMGNQWTKTGPSGITGEIASQQTQVQAQNSSYIPLAGGNQRPPPSQGQPSGYSLQQYQHSGGPTAQLQNPEPFSYCEDVNSGYQQTYSQQTGLPTHQRRLGQQAFGTPHIQGSASYGQSGDHDRGPTIGYTPNLGHNSGYGLSNDSTQVTNYGQGQQWVAHSQQPAQHSVGSQQYQSSGMYSGPSSAPVSGGYGHSSGFQTALANVELSDSAGSDPAPYTVSANSSRSMYRRKSQQRAAEEEGEEKDRGSVVSGPLASLAINSGPVSAPAPVPLQAKATQQSHLTTEMESQQHQHVTEAAPMTAAVGSSDRKKPSSRKVSASSRPLSSLIPANPQFIEWACLQSNEEVVKRLEADHIRVDEGTDADGNTLLHKACEVGNISLVFFLHETYPSMDCSRNNSSGMQPLHVACAKGMLHIVMYLINNRLSDPTSCTTDGRSALHVAASHNYPALVSYLVSVMPPASCTVSESRGFTALHLACMEGHDAVVQVLIGARGVNIFQLDRLGRNCMDMAIILGHLSVLRLLLALPTNIRPDVSTAHGVHNYTGLHWACANLQYAVIKYLVQDVGVDVDATDTSGLTPDKVVSDPIVTLLVTGSVTDKEMLIAENAIREYQVQGRNKESAQEVGSKQAQVRKDVVSADNKKTAFEEEEESEESEEDEEEPGEEEEEGEGSDSESSASSEDEEEGSDSDDDEDGDDKEEKKTSHTPELGGLNSILFELVQDECNIEKLELVLGAAPDIKRDVRAIRNTKTGETLLHVASKYPYLSTIQYLVEGVGSDIDAVDKDGRTSLHNAVIHSRLVVVRYLVKHAGAALDVKDSKGKTALELCSGSSADADEIKKIISKSVGKAPAKRRKVDIPEYGGKK